MIPFKTKSRKTLYARESRKELGKEADIQVKEVREGYNQLEILEEMQESGEYWGRKA